MLNTIKIGNIVHIALPLLSFCCYPICYQDSMKRILLRLCLGLILLIAPLSIRAAEVVEITPKETLVKETDIGKTFEIELKNNSDKTISLVAREVRINRLNNEITSVDAGKEVLEMMDSKIQIESGSTFTHKIRIKFSSQDFAASYPAVKYLSDDNSSELVYKIEDQAIFLIQSLEGDYKLGLDAQLANPDITTSNTVKLLITIKNEGEKYFIPDGTMSIYFKEKPIFEQKLTDLINKRLFAGEEISLDIEHILEDSTLQAIGEYKVEVKINSDYSANQKIATITFMYIPYEIITKAGIIIGGALIFISIIILIRKIKKH